MTNNRQHWLCVIVLQLCFFFSARLPSPVEAVSICEPSERWRLVWSDEFNGNSLNTSNWTPLDKASPRNHEKEDYDPENVFVSDSDLVLVTKREKRDHMNYTSGLVASHDKAYFKYGRMCVRAKLPPGKDGIWPAHWMVPNDHYCWPDRGELDIMEMINGDDVLHGTLHWNPDYPKKNCTSHDKSCAFRKSNISVDDYHEFAVEWSSTSVTFYVDGEPYGQCLNSSSVHIPNVPMSFILNTAVGGNWPKQPDNTTVFPQEHLIDYVRVAQQAHKDDLPSDMTITQPPNYFNYVNRAASLKSESRCVSMPNQTAADPLGWCRNGGDFQAIRLDRDDDMFKCIELCCSEPRCLAFSFNNPQPLSLPSCPKGSVCCVLKDQLPDVERSTYGSAVQTGTVVPWKMLPSPTPPFPHSNTITAMVFSEETFLYGVRDFWSFAWAADDEMYGVSLTRQSHQSKIGVWKVSGFPNQNLTVNLVNNYQLDLSSVCPQTNILKPSSLLAVDNVIFMGLSCINAGNNLQFSQQQMLGFIAVSEDLGRTWSVPENDRAMFKGRFSAPQFVQFGKGNRYGPDASHQVYALFSAAVGELYWENNDVMYLGRTTTGEAILDASLWEFFSGYGSHGLTATWTSDPTKAVPVISYHSMLGKSSVSYNHYLKRFIIANYGFIDLISGLPQPQHHAHDGLHFRKSNRRQLILLEAEQPWGPWSMFYHEDIWESSSLVPGGYRGTGHYIVIFPPKWMSESNHMWMAYSGNLHNHTLLGKKVEFVTSADM